MIKTCLEIMSKIQSVCIVFLSRIDFKILMFVFKILNGLAPEYLADLIQVHRPIRALRSANKLHLDVPKSRLKTKCDRAFAVVAPKLWNGLLLHIQSSETLDIFKSALKTPLFSQAFGPG